MATKLQQLRGLPLPERILNKKGEVVCSAYREQFPAHTVPPPERASEQVRRARFAAAGVTHVEPSHYETTACRDFRAVDIAECRVRSFKPKAHRVRTSKFAGTPTSVATLPGQWDCSPPRRVPHPRTSDCLLCDSATPQTFFSTTTRDEAEKRAAAQQRGDIIGRPPSVRRADNILVDHSVPLEGCSSYSAQFVRPATQRDVVRYTRKSSPTQRLRQQRGAGEACGATVEVPKRAQGFYTTTSQDFFRAPSASPALNSL